MRQEAEQLFWVHTRGLVVTLPPDATRRISSAVDAGKPIPSEESSRLRVITMDPILKKRYPVQENGSDFMGQVCPDRRVFLYQKAVEVSGVIVQSARKIRKPKVAVILFGSVAKALVKRDGHGDPSNIDLAVIGDFNKNDREIMLDMIRDERDRVKTEIGNNVGVFVQSRDSVRGNNFDTAFNYIGSCARPLWDPHRIWRDLESAALSETGSVRRFINNGNNH